MASGMNWCWLWFPAVADAWWFAYLTWGLTALTAAALALAFFPRFGSGAVTWLEQAIARLAWPLHWLVTIGLLTSAPLAAISLIVLNLSPTRPKIMPYVSRANPAQVATIKDADIPVAFRSLPRIDPTGLIDEVLHAAHALNAQDWLAADATEREQLRALCSLASENYLRTRQLPPPRSPLPELPLWVLESVEMAIVDALLLIEQPAWTGVRCGPIDPQHGWGLRKRLPNRRGTRLIVLADLQPVGPRVTLLFGGQATQDNKQVQFRALVEQLQPPTTTGSILPFVVTDDRNHRQSVSAPFDPALPFQIVEVNAPVSGFDKSASLVATAASGKLRTPLPLAASGANAGVVNLENRDGAVPTADFTRLWQELLADPTQPLAQRLKARQAPVPVLNVGGMQPQNPSLVILEDGKGVLVLAPGLSPARVPSAWLTKRKVPRFPTAAAVAGSPPQTIEQFAARPTAVRDTPGNVDSWRSAEVATNVVGNEVQIPVGSSELVWETWSLRTNSPFSAGRHYKSHGGAGGERVEQPLVLRGTIDGLPLIYIPLSLREQSLLWPTTDADRERFEPNRARAFLNSLVTAVQRVQAAAESSPAELERSQGRWSAGSPLWNAGDRTHISAVARRHTDAWGLAGLGVFLLFVNIHYFVWRMR